MKIYLAVPFGLLLALSFADCTSTVVDVQNVYVPTGPASARFISMMPDNSAIILKLTPNGSSFYSTLSTTQPSYLPLVPDSAERYYLSFTWEGKSLNDSISISGAALKNASENTFALFLIDTSIRSVGGGNNDSNKYLPVSQGFARLRFINGVSGYPTPVATVNLDLDTVTDSIATVPFGVMSDYELVPAGTHKLIVCATENQHPLVTAFQVFEAGGFYTARYIGIHGDTTFPDRLVVDPE